MKQEYRHTKPYRGKDPNFEKEELTEQEINDTLERRLKVSRKLKKTFKQEINDTLERRLKVSRKLKKTFNKL